MGYHDTLIPGAGWDLRPIDGIEFKDDSYFVTPSPATGLGEIIHVMFANSIPNERFTIGVRDLSNGVAYQGLVIARDVRAYSEMQRQYMEMFKFGAEFAGRGNFHLRHILEEEHRQHPLGGFALSRMVQHGLVWRTRFDSVES